MTYRTRCAKWQSVWLFVLIAAIAFFRDPTAYVLPAMPLEDGRDLFAYFYNHQNQGLRAVWHSYAGYVSVGPNLVGYLALQLPITLAPFVVSWFPLCLYSLSLTLIAGRTSALILPNPHLRLLTCITLAVLPLGNFALQSLTMYSLWSGLLILSLLAIRPHPQQLHPLWTWCAVVVQVILIWSHPLSIVLAPVYLLRVWLQRRSKDSFFDALLFLATILYALVAVDWTTSNRVSLGLDQLLLGARFVIERVVFESLAGSRLRFLLYKFGFAPAIWLGVSTIAGMLLLFFVRLRRMRTDEPERSDKGAQILFPLLLLYLICAFTAAGVLGRDRDSSYLATEWGQRYFYVSKALFVVLVFHIGHRVARKYDGLRGSLAGSPKPNKLSLFFLGYVLIVNFSNLQYYKTDKQAGIDLRNFLAQDQVQERRLDELRNEPAILERANGRWSIVLSPAD